LTKKFSFLFWLGNNISQFAVANSLQEKIECKFNGIISSNDKFKDFYQKQKFVEFENLWVYPDYIENFDANPDMDYLSDFEKKYQISLWEIIFSERIFSYNYNKFHKFTQNELLLILEQACKFFESIFDKISPDVVIAQLPIGHDDYLFYKMCNFFNFRTLYIRRSRLGYRTKIVDNQTSDLNENIIDDKSLNSFEDIENYLTNFSSYKQFQKNKSVVHQPIGSKFISFLKFYFGFSKTNKKYYSTMGKNRWNLTKLDSNFSRKLRLKSRERFLNQIYLKNIEKNTPFIFFPLHFEPERSLLIENRFHSNQLHIIECISKSLPINFQLYVKDHPAMKKRGWRDISFYKKIINLPNVNLLSPLIDPKIILNNCSLVIAISGTLGIEAAFYNKPSIIFGREDISLPSSIIQIDNLKDLPNTINKALQTKPNISEIVHFINQMMKNSFDYDVFEIDDKFNQKFPYLGYLNNPNLIVSEIQKFIHENKEIFERLTMEYLDKLGDLVKPYQK